MLYKSFSSEYPDNADAILTFPDNIDRSIIKIFFSGLKKLSIPITMLQDYHRISCKLDRKTGKIYFKFDITGHKFVLCQGYFRLKDLLITYYMKREVIYRIANTKRKGYDFMLIPTNTQYS